MSDAETKALTEISVKVGRLEIMQETNIRAINDMASSVNRLVEKLDKSDDIAREADQRARSAHHRIDDIKNGQKWLIGTTISMIGLFIAAVGFLWKLTGK